MAQTETQRILRQKKDSRAARVAFTQHRIDIGILDITCTSGNNFSFLQYNGSDGGTVFLIVDITVLERPRAIRSLDIVGFL